MPKSIDPRIFRAYDIRGKVGDQLTEEGCTLIARAFGTELRERYQLSRPRVCVGMDARTHSPAFEAAVLQGLLSVGCEVIRIGAVPSPVNYFTICSENLDGGIHVTASHNPPCDNGLKLSIRGAEAFAGEDIQKLRRRCEEQSRGERIGPKGGPSAERGKSIEDSYLSFLLERFPHIGKNFRIVIDAGNGVAGPLSSRVLRAVGCDVHELYTEPDGTFPHHAADPSQHVTLRDLQQEVLTRKAHFGVAFDGDGDRLGLVTETGDIVSPDSILLLLAQDLLSRHPGSPIIFTVSNSSILETEIARWGGKSVLSKVGHSFVEHAMRENYALLGGEQSGHFFCAENYFAFDDALVTALRILTILRNRSLPLSTLLAAFPRVYQGKELRPSCPDETKGKIIERVKEHFLRRYPVNTLDGARIDFGSGAWAGIRQSNTSPCISICTEARDPSSLRRIEDEVLTHLQSYPELHW